MQCFNSLPIAGAKYCPPFSPSWLLLILRYFTRLLCYKTKQKMKKHSIRNETEKKLIHKCIKMETLIYVITWIASVRVWIALSSKVFPIKLKQRGVLLNICGDEKVVQRRSKCTILVPYCSFDLVKKSIAPNTYHHHHCIFRSALFLIEESNNSIELFSNYCWKYFILLLPDCHF